jgi:hypothetical protein
VGVILPEGPDSAGYEVWTSAEVAEVQTSITNDFATFAALYPEAKLTFVIRFESAPPPWNPIAGIVRCDGYDPIVQIQGPNLDWDRPLIQQCTFPNLGLSHTDGRTYVHDLRTQLQADWGIGIYVVDTSCTCSYGDTPPSCTDPPPNPNCPFPNALIGGPTTVVPNRYIAALVHETGHLFRAWDEYPHAGGGGNPLFMTGFFHACNANGVANQGGFFNGTGEGQACVMNTTNAPFPVCPYTRQAWGWRDIDGDGIFDPRDYPPRATLGSPVGSTISGLAEVSPVPRDLSPSNCAGYGPWAYVIQSTSTITFGIDLSSPYSKLELLPPTGSNLEKGVFAASGVATISGSGEPIGPKRWLKQLAVSASPKKSEQWNARVEVRDEAGDTRQSVVSVWANPYNAPPVAQAVVTAVNGLAVSFSAAGSTDPNQSMTWDNFKRVRWDFDGDGIWDRAFSTTLTASHTYSASGTYNVIAQVRDRHAAFSSTTLQVTVPQ